MLTQEEKTQLIEKYKLHDADTGSSEVQVVLLSEEIDRLLSHLKIHPKDFHSKRGLLKMVSKRRKLMSYLKGTDEKRYEELVKKAGLKSK
ncbi:MAG: 30S ribosomal protein S15 [Candidatus Nealsonbacteria bacterium RIFOXYB1_FULL_40_15]|uniref:Small ribosomal subunit protein uS15 n=2 Tax=Candidatus Nealsoniibacteriota TaxID=1817911 RepID=A0A1G2EN35_9BACT|nr:MAG: 30S ribosomal protein S15 [Candidatus Nealsonbacteria bacterium RIFOXYC1_FULL_40_7]OGZ27245.1 MAG: 30S ribosomal protein S15 [Candidatus Nealsonbacteria bacterium RIFOXYB1_FULL_40_15]OGZ29282.1 MAG: 30S ribosomal protein S15 [Candidatus Nealsonbacteria bacterium RIFOXYD1_FULL_39_11]